MSDKKNQLPLHINAIVWVAIILGTSFWVSSADIFSKNIEAMIFVFQIVGWWVSDRLVRRRYDIPDDECGCCM